MFEQLRKAREDEGGFTLIELLIVIVILGILAAVVVFAVGGVTNKGNQAACQSDVKTIEVAAEAYYAQNGVGATALTGGATALVPGFMHSSASIAGNTQTGSGYTVTYAGPSAGNPAGTVTANVTANPVFTCP